MEIYLDHPHNGATVAYSAAEAAQYEAKGWKIRKPQPGEVAEAVAKTFDSPEPTTKRKG